MTRDGRMVWEWRSWEHLDPAKDTITAIQDKRSEWTHGNAIAELPDGNLLVSFRDISTIIKIERQTGHIVWSLGAPPLSGQHAPTPLPNGNILIFDNGPHRLDESFPFSRVIEVNPRTKDIVWKYQEGVPSNFFSPRISNAQRLPNGNTSCLPTNRPERRLYASQNPFAQVSYLGPRSSRKEDGMLFLRRQLLRTLPFAFGSSFILGRNQLAIAAQTAVQPKT